MGGQVEMMNYKMAMRIRSKAETLSPDNELHPATLAKEIDSQESEHAEVSQDETSQEQEEDMEVQSHIKKANSKRNMESKRKRLEQETQEMEAQYNKKFKKSMKQ